MKKLLFVLLVIGFSCTKEKPACEENNIGELCVSNAYPNSAKVLINGKDVGLVASAGQFCRDISAGITNVTLIDELTANSKSKQIEVVQCSTTGLIIP